MANEQVALRLHARVKNHHKNGYADTNFHFGIYPLLKVKGFKCLRFLAEWILRF